MAVEVILPKVDMDMTTGRISSWLVEEGATVKKGDVLFEIETDKAAMEIDSPAAGILRNITGKEGIDIPVGEVVAWVYEEGEAVADAPAAAPAETVAEEPAKAEAPASAEVPAPAATPVAAVASASGVRASPLARRLAKEAGLDLSAISGSGPKGRIVKADVEAAGKDGGAKAAAAPASAPAAAQPMSDDQVMKLFGEGSYELIPHDSMRKTIARRLVEAKSTIPHFYLTLDCEIDALLALRKQLNEAAPKVKTEDGEKPAYKLSVNDMVIKRMPSARHGAGGQRLVDR